MSNITSKLIYFLRIQYPSRNQNYNEKYLLILRWSRILVKKIWIIDQSGVCLLQHNFESSPSSIIDDNTIGGITASLLNFSSITGFDEGNIDAITIGDSKLNYFYDDNVIVCLETINEVKEKLIQKVGKISIKVSFSDLLPFLNLITLLIRKFFPLSRLNSLRSLSITVYCRNQMNYFKLLRFLQFLILFHLFYYLFCF